MRRRKLLSALGYLLLVGLASMFAWEHSSPSVRSRNDWTMFDHQAFVVSRVVDGDTIHVRSINGSRETIVRLIGIDAPELHDPSTGRPAHWAERARNYVLGRAGGKTITLSLEPIETRDRYDRLLAYVYLSESDCLNMDLVRDGQAYADRRFRHAFRPQYEQAEGEARRKQRGLWKDLTEAQMPAWRRAWLHARDE